MAIYQSGSVAGVVALLEAIKDFAVARGWTNNSYTTDGSGQRLHISKGNAFFNFKALVNETPPNAFGGRYGVYGNGSTGYNGADAWYDQPGGPKYGSTVYPIAGMPGLGSVGTPSPTLNYHLFWVDRPNLPASGTITGATNASPIEITQANHGKATGDRVVISGVGGNTAANGTWIITKTGTNTYTLNGSTGSGAYTSGGSATALADCIYCVVEYPSGTWAWMFFGTIDKTETGEVSGGHFITGSARNDDPVRGILHGFGPQMVYNLSQQTPEAAGMIYATVDGTTGWKISGPGTGTAANGNQRVMDTVNKIRTMVNCSPNLFNSRTVLHPWGIMVTRDGTTLATNTPWSILGFMPELYYCNIRNLVPGSLYSIGSTDYRVFPMCRKSDATYNVFAPETRHFGFAIRAN